MKKQSLDEIREIKRLFGTLEKIYGLILDNTQTRASQDYLESLSNLFHMAIEELVAEFAHESTKEIKNTQSYSVFAQERNKVGNTIYYDSIDEARVSFRIAIVQSNWLIVELLDHTGDETIAIETHVNIKAKS